MIKLSIKWFLVIFTVFFILLIVVFTAVELGGYKKHRFYIQELSLSAGLDYNLVLAVVRTESSFNENAVSKKGAVGLMQLMPKTAEFIAKKVGYEGEVDLYNPTVNLYLGISYLKYLFDKYENETIVLCCYNAGEGTVSKWTEEEVENPPYKETREYIKKVKRRKSLYKIFI
ncbi:MAG: lytic transglycosylase domain-containing protein [Clostridia bacterium]|nr:lytic transglycosylase domain-containing protein [Clostridia bacterium]